MALSKKLVQHLKRFSMVENAKFHQKITMFTKFPRETNCSRTIMGSHRRQAGVAEITPEVARITVTQDLPFDFGTFFLRSLGV